MYYTSEALYNALTEHQKQVLALEAQGLAQQAIAKELNITQQAVSAALNTQAVQRYKERLISGDLRAKIIEGWKETLSSKNYKERLRALIELSKYIPEQIKQFLLMAYEPDETAPERIEAQPIHVMFATILQGLNASERLRLIGAIEHLEQQLNNIQQSTGDKGRDNGGHSRPGNVVGHTAALPLPDDSVKE